MTHTNLIEDLAKAIHAQLAEARRPRKDLGSGSWQDLIPAANAAIAVLTEKRALVPGTFLNALLSQCDLKAPLPREDISSWLDSEEVGQERLERPEAEESAVVDRKIAQMQAALVARVLDRGEEKHKIVLEYSSDCEALLRLQKQRITTEIRSDTVPFLREGLALLAEGTAEYTELAHTTVLMENLANQVEQEVTTTIDALVEERSQYAASVLGEDYRALFQKASRS